MNKIKVASKKHIPKNFSGIVEYLDGTKQWFENGLKHRADGEGPAHKGKDGLAVWFFKGKIHRENGPAKIYPHGSKFWYINNKLHRTDGPAIEFWNGEVEYWIDGKRVSKEDLNL